MLDEVRRAQTKKGTARPPSRGSQATAKPQKLQCKRCGRERHPAEKCPAKNATCYKCNRIGHFSSQCFSKTAPACMHEVSLDSAFLGAVTSQREPAWTATVLLGKTEVVFKLDTGAEVTAISEATYKQLDTGPLEKASKALYGPTHQSLKVLGQFNGTLVQEHQGHRSMQTVFVVQDLKSNLLGLPAIASLQLLQGVDATYTREVDFHNQFPKVFQGLGTLGEKYQIQLKEGTVPYAIYTPRHVAIPLRGKVREELERMEAVGVISKVDKATPWCAGMVTIPKKSGDVQICVDLKSLNESVLREVHPMPKVDETLAQLAWVAFFSKLDANSGF